MLQNHTQPCDRPVKMMERSLYSAKFCFAENLRRTGRMPQSEYEVLSGWFDFMLQCPDIDLGADLIVYLRTDPEVALRRVRGRRRGEEHLISEAYIRDLHTLHEDWLMQHKERVISQVCRLWLSFNQGFYFGCAQLTMKKMSINYVTLSSSSPCPRRCSW